MSRGYLKVNSDGSWQAVKALQGNATDYDSAEDCAGWGHGLKLAALAETTAPGLYRVKLVSDHYYGRPHFFVTLGAMVKDPAKESARLTKRIGEAATRARTGSPGIAGYQHMENMSSARLMNVRGESEALVRWLDGLASNG